MAALLSPKGVDCVITDLPPMQGINAVVGAKRIDQGPGGASLAVRMLATLEGSISVVNTHWML